MSFNCLQVICAASLFACAACFAVYKRREKDAYYQSNQANAAFVFFGAIAFAAAAAYPHYQASAAKEEIKKEMNDSASKARGSAKVRLYLKTFKYKLLPQDGSRPRQNQSVNFGFSSNNEVLLPIAAYENVKNIAAASSLFAFQTDPEDGRKITIPDEERFPRKNLIVASWEDHSERDVFPAWEAADKQFEKRKELARKSCEEGRPYVRLDDDEAKSAKKNPTYVFVFSCAKIENSRRGAPKSPSLSNVASYALKLEGGFLNVSPRRSSGKGWNFHSVEMKPNDFIIIGGREDSILPNVTFAELPSPAGGQIIVTAPKNLFECNDWEKINSYSEALMVTRKDPRHDTICHIYANPFEFNAALLAPDIGGIDRRSSAVAAMFLFVLVFSAFVFLYYSYNANENRAFLYASRFAGLFFASVFFFVLFQYRLLWSHRLDFLRPDKFLWDTSKFLPVGDMTVDNLVLCLAAAAALSGFALVSLPPIESFLGRKIRGWNLFYLSSFAAFCAASAVFGAAFYFLFIKEEIPYNYEELFFKFLWQSAIFIGFLFFAAAHGKNIVKWAMENGKALALTAAAAAVATHLTIYFVALYKPGASSSLVKLCGSSTMLVNYVAALSSGPLFYGVLSAKGSARRFLIRAALFTLGMFILIKTPNPGKEPFSPGSFISGLLYGKTDFGMMYMYVVPGVVAASLVYCYGVYRETAASLEERSRRHGYFLAISLTALPLVMTLSVGLYSDSALMQAAYPIRNPIAYGFLLTVAAVCFVCAAIILIALSRLSSGDLPEERRGRFRNARYLLAAILIAVLAVIVIPMSKSFKAKAMTYGSAQRFTILFEPRLSALSNFKKFYDNILPWKESASAETVDAYYKLYGGESEAERPEAYREEAAKYEELKKSAIVTGEGYFRSDFYDKGVKKSLNNDYFALLLFREGGVSELIFASVLLTSFALLILFSPNSLRPAAREGSAQSRDRINRFRIVALAALFVLFYQPIAAAGGLPFTGIPLPLLGLDSKVEFLCFFAVFILAAATHIVPPAARDEYGDEEDEGEDAYSHRNAFSDSAAPAWPFALIFIGACACGYYFAYAHSAERAVKFEKTWRSGSEITLLFVSLFAFEKDLVFNFDGKLMPKETIKGNSIAGVNAKIIRDEILYPRKMTKPQSLDVSKLENLWFAKWIAGYSDAKKIDEASAAAYKTCYDPESKEDDEKIISNWGTVKKSAGYCRITYSANSALAYAIKLPLKNAEDPTRVSFENKLYALIKNGDLKEVDAPKYRLVAQAQGQALDDVAELVSSNVIVRLRKTAGVNELKSETEKPISGLHIARKFTIENNAEFSITDDDKIKIKYLSGGKSEPDGGGKKALFIFKYVKSNIPIRISANRGAEWSLIKIGPSEGKSEETFSGLAILLLEKENGGQRIWSIRTRQGKNESLPWVLADSYSVYGKKDKLNRLYLYGEAIPELGTLNTGYGIDDWYAAFLRENSDKTRDIIYERAKKYQDMYCGTRKPLPKNDAAASVSGFTPWEDSICPESNTDGTRECKISMQPELELHFKNILDYAAVNAGSYSGGKPAREAQALLTDGQTGEILANAYYNIESEDKVFAPRFPKFKKWGDYVLNLDYARNQNNKTLKESGCRLDDLQKELEKLQKTKKRQKNADAYEAQEKEIFRLMYERKKGCVAALHRKYFTADDEDGLIALNVINTIKAKKSVLFGLSGSPDKGRSYKEEFRQEIYGADKPPSGEAEIQGYDEGKTLQLYERWVKFLDISKTESHFYAYNSPWSNPPKDVGSAFKPILAQAVYLADPDFFNAVEFGPIDFAAAAKSRNPKRKFDVLYGHRTANYLYEKSEPGPYDVKGFIEASVNWFMGALGVLLPAVDAEKKGKIVLFKDDSSEELVNENLFLKDGKGSGKLNVKRPDKFELSDPLIVKYNQKTVISQTGVNLDELVESPAWKNLEALIGRKLCREESCVEKNYAFYDLCSMRDAPLLSPSSQRLPLVSLGNSMFVIGEDKEEDGSGQKVGTGKCADNKIDDATYFNFLRGSSSCESTFTILQLGDAYLRLFFDAPQKDSSGNYYAKTLRWIPPVDLNAGAKKEKNKSAGLYFERDCLQTDGMSKIQKGLCGVLNGKSGTARAIFSEALNRNKSALNRVIFHGAKTGTANSMIGVSDDDALFENDLKKFELIGKSDVYSLRKGDPDDSLFVVAFSVNGRPFALTLYFKATGSTGAALAGKAAKQLIHIVQDYYSDANQ